MHLSHTRITPQEVQRQESRLGTRFYQNQPNFTTISLCKKSRDRRDPCNTLDPVPSSQLGGD